VGIAVFQMDIPLLSCIILLSANGREDRAILHYPIKHNSDYVLGVDMKVH